MTAEAKECNGRREEEVDLKAAAVVAAAAKGCGENGGEGGVGGEFVIVNGDSDGMSNGSEDPGSELDNNNNNGRIIIHHQNQNNGELGSDVVKVEEEESLVGSGSAVDSAVVGVEEESDHRDAVVEDSESSVVNVEETTQEREAVVEDSGSAINLLAETHEAESGATEEVDSSVLVEESKETEPVAAEISQLADSGSVVSVGESEEREAVVEDLASEAESGVTEIDHAGEESKEDLEAVPVVLGVDQPLDSGSVVDVEEIHKDSEAAVNVEEARDSEAVVAEIDQAEESEAVVNVEETQDSKAVVAEIDQVEESESAVNVEESQEMESVVDHLEDPRESVPVEETQEPESVAPQADESSVSVEETQEPESVVAENSESAFPAEEMKEEPEPEVPQIVDQLLKEPFVTVEELQEEPEVPVVVENGNEEDSESSVIIEEPPETRPMVVEHPDDDSSPYIRVEEVKETRPEPVVTHPDGSEPFIQVEEVKEGYPEPIVTEVDDEESQEPESVVTDADRQEVSVSAVDTEETAVPETAVVEHVVVLESAEEERKPESVSNVAEVDPVVEVEVKQEPEVLPAETDEVEAEEIQEVDGAVTETTQSESLPVDEKEAELPNPAVDVNSDIDSTSKPSVDEPEAEARDIPLESFVSPELNHVVVDEVLAKEVSCPTVDKDVEMEVANEATAEPEAEQSISTVVPVNDAELDTGVCINVDESEKVVAVDLVGETKLESENGTAESAECMGSPVEGEHSTNKDDDEEHANGQTATVEEVPVPTKPKWQHVYLIKLPRFVDEELQKKIQVAQSQLDERTRKRDSIRDEIQSKRAICDQHRQALDAAVADKELARSAFAAKRQEFDSVQVTINKMKNATSIAEIDDKIRDMSHKQQHETITLKQEKQYIHEITQLRHLRDQLASKKVPQEQIDEAFGQKVEVEARSKTIRKELDSLRAALSQAEGKTQASRNKFRDESQLLRNLQDQYNVADELRQEAYISLQKLKRESSEKIKNFYTYKDDRRIAENYLFSGDIQGLISHCNKQVESVMEAWNNDEEFRKLYVKNNVDSTVRRLQTLDGRPLGPGEEAPILHSYVDRKSIKPSVTSPSTETAAPAPLVTTEVKQESSGEQLSTKHVARTNQSAKSKLSAKSNSREAAVVATVSNSDETKVEEKEKKLTKEEEELAKKEEELARKAEELARKEEEIKKEKAAAELKEKLRQEQKAKAREAEERKKRKAEKAQAKAEHKAQKEAELREQRKTKKKEKKKTGTTDTTDRSAEEESAPVTDTISPGTSPEPETKVTAARKRSARPAAALKQYNKIEPLPLPLRNRSKRKMATWMWVLVTILVVLVLFLAGNYVSFSKFSLPDFGF